MCDHRSSAYNKVSNGAAWKLALVAGMQKGSNKGVEQSLNVFTRENLAWTAGQMSTYKMVEAVGGFISGRVSPQAIHVLLPLIPLPVVTLMTVLIIK